MNRALVSAAALSASHQRLCARSVTVIRVVVSAVSVPDLSEQFTPPETAPPALVSLIQAIEKQGICVFPVSLLSVWPPSFCLHVTCPPCASYPHVRICVDVEAIRGACWLHSELCAAVLIHTVLLTNSAQWEAIHNFASPDIQSYIE